MKTCIVSVLLAAVFFMCAGVAAQAAPALWLVESPTAKVYLFGTVHILREGTQWRSSELEAAMTSSQDLYLEIADPANVSAALSSLVKVGFDREHPLSTKITKADVQLLDAIAKRDGFGGEAAFDTMQPWLVYLILSLAPARQAGYAAPNGADVQVRQEFVAAGKPIYGFETIDMQAHIFADLPQATQVALLESVLKNANRTGGVTKLNAIVSAWESGNQDDLAAAMQLDKLAQSPFEAKLLTDRNKAWADALAKRLAQTGTSFVSVGAAHMLGPQGVPALLAQMGYKVTRVQIAEVLQTALPSASPAVPVASPGASSSPAASATALPAPGLERLTPPPGWTARTPPASATAFKIDKMWADPNRRGAVLVGHLDIPGATGLDLDTLDGLIHQGLPASADVQVQPSKRVKICNGSQDGMYSKVVFKTIAEDMVVAVSDRGYIAQYARSKDQPDYPAALHSLLTLCVP